jgi:hypothetical protein
MTYTITVTLSVDEHTEHMQGDQEIRDEVRSWLEGLGATVTAVKVEEEPS